MQGKRDCEKHATKKATLTKTWRTQYKVLGIQKPRINVHRLSDEILKGSEFKDASYVRS